MKRQNLSGKIDIKFHSGIYTLTVEQQLPVSLDQAWQFFSSPENLSKITPPELKFDLNSEKPDKMFAGQIITSF